MVWVGVGGTPCFSCATPIAAAMPASASRAPPTMSAELWLLTGLAGFAAGLLDSIVGGGGLILTPAMLNLHPGLNILQTIATQRTSSLLGTSVAAWNYFRHVAVERRIVVPALVAALRRRRRMRNSQKSY